MRVFLGTIFGVLLAGGATVSVAQGYRGDPIGAKRTESLIAASCRMWDANAERAANPDAATIARHDEIMTKIDGMMEKRSDPSKIAQLQIEADDLYDWQYKHRVAMQCWAELGVMHDDNEERLKSLAALAASSRSTNSYQFDPKGHVLDTHPPTPMQAPPSSDLGNMYQHRRQPHGCIGNVPVAGPGLNPCPSP